MSEIQIVAPKVTTDLAAKVFTFENIGIVIRVEKLDYRGDCELYVYHKTDDKIQLLRHTNAHLLSTSHLTTIIRELNKNIKLDWSTMFTYITNLALTEYRQGEPIIELDESYGKVAPEYLLYPLFIKNAVNTIYADRSSAKTMFIILVDIMLSLPWTDNPLGLNINSHPHKILFLDYENNSSITGWTANCIIRGTGIGFCPIQYQHCSLPFADDIAEIRKKVAEINADTIIIDSLGMAVGDDLILTKPAFKFFSALRQLDPITTIMLGHTAKNAESKNKTVYGNAYYENEARCIWEIRKDQEPNSPELTINLYNRKPPPFAPIHSPLAYKFLFDRDRISIGIGDVKADARTLPDVSEQQIIEAIINDNEKALSYKDIYEESGDTLTFNHIRVYCYNLIKEGKAVSAGRGMVKRNNNVIERNGYKKT